METETNMDAQKQPEKKSKKKEKVKKTLGQEILSWVWTLLAAVVIATLLRAFVAEPIRVDGTSMTNTLQDGEIVLVSKLDYLTGDMQRGDIVICRYPNRVEKTINLGASLAFVDYTIFVKRLVALPGDTVEIRNTVLYVNDEPVENPEKLGSLPRDYARRTLGADEYFVMGDNRLTSHDSRADNVGPLSKSMILGKAKRVIFPFSNWRSVE
ncbi:MAG: signal peptidase I [Clostridiales bacterium]|nr:signal peptidase I [Clostridiales bacterium]